jgi:hypothetical protein
VGEVANGEGGVSWRVRPGGRHRRPAWDPRDEPSAEWGWHGSFPNGSRIAGVVVAILLLVLLIGPYQTHLRTSGSSR